MPEQFQIYDNLFDEEFIQLTNSYCKDSPHWFYGRIAAPDKSATFWGSALWEEGMEKKFFLEYIYAKVTKASGIKFRLRNVALNGQTSNQFGGWHTDIYTNERLHPKRLLTMIYYVNSTWDDPKGSTWLKLVDGTEHEIKFVPGRVAIFPSSMLHYGDCPEQNNLLRISLAFKLELI